MMCHVRKTIVSKTIVRKTIVSKTIVSKTIVSKTIVSNQCYFFLKILSLLQWFGFYDMVT